MSQVIALLELLLIPLRALARVFGGGFAVRVRFLSDVIATLRAVDRLLRLQAEGKLPPVVERRVARGQRRRLDGHAERGEVAVRGIASTPLPPALSPQLEGDGVIFVRSVRAVFARGVPLIRSCLTLCGVWLAQVRKIGDLAAAWICVLFVPVTQFMAGNPSGQGGKRLTLRA